MTRLLTGDRPGGNESGRVLLPKGVPNVEKLM